MPSLFDPSEQSSTTSCWTLNRPVRPSWDGECAGCFNSRRPKQHDLGQESRGPGFSTHDAVVSGVALVCLVLCVSLWNPRF